MSMKIVEDRYGQVLGVEATADHAWRRVVALYLLGGIIFLWAVAGFVLIADPETGWITKIALFAVATLVARLLALFVQALLTPRSGVRELRFDRSDGEVVLTRHSVFRQPKPQMNHLSDLSRVRLRATASPSISLGGLLSSFQAAREVEGLDEEESGRENLSSMPLEFRLSMVFDSGSEEIKMAVEDVRNEVEAIVLASKLAAACGLRYQKVYTLPQVGLEIQLSQQEIPGFDLVPEAEEGLQSLAERSLAAAGPSPFDPDSFQADHRIREWSPGRSVVFERVPSKARFLALPFTPLVLVGPAMLLAAATDSLPFNTLRVVVLSGLGLLIGGIAIVIVRIPSRRVEIDWNHRNLVIIRRSKRVILPFDELEKLELKGVAHEGGGDSGGSWSYWCKLQAIRRNGAGETSAPVELLTTRQTRKSDEPWRQATPLLETLAAALEVDAITTDYKS